MRAKLFSPTTGSFSPNLPQKLLLVFSIIIISVLAQNTLVLRLSLGEMENLRIGFGALFTILGGIWLGPFWGGFIGGVSDLLSYSIHPEGPYLFTITLVSILRGVIPGVMRSYLRPPFQIKNLLLLVGTPQIICSILLMPLILNQGFGLPLVENIYHRIWIQVFTIPLYMAIIYVLLKQWESAKQLQVNEEKYRSIFKNSPMGIIYYNHEGIITDCNQAAVGIMGSTHYSLLGLDLNQLNNQGMVDALQQSLAGLRSSFEGRYPDESSPEEKYVRAIFNPLTFNGEVNGGTGIIEDSSSRKLAEKNLQKIADTDDLTGLWNRRYFLQALRMEMERNQRYHAPFSLVMMDIDDFKAINDNWGHAAGDKVLKQLSFQVSSRLRQIDVLGRVGGEEFCLLLPGTDKEGAVKLTESLRQTLENTPVIYNHQEIYFTISAGITTYSQDISSVDQLLNLADHALYQAKARGKNCIVV